MEQSNGYTFNYNIPQFQLGYKMNNFLSLNYPSISSNGSSSNKSFRQSIMGTIGEAFERQSLLNFVDKTHQICLQMRDGKIIQVELNDKNKKYFHDTCGLATYTNTKNAFQNALKEFIERQSFVFTYLSKKAKCKIEKDEHFYEIVSPAFHFLDFFEISLIDTFKVVFCIGQREEHSIDIGLGAGKTMKDALENVLKEIVPFQLPHKKLKRNKNEHLDYIHMYHSLPVSRIIEAFRFLKNGESYYLKKNEKSFEDNQIIAELVEKYDMDIQVCSHFIDNNDKFRNYSAKSVKVLDLNWFPSLAVVDFTEEIYAHVESKTNSKLNRDINFIPFP